MADLIPFPIRRRRRLTDDRLRRFGADGSDADARELSQPQSPSSDAESCFGGPLPDQFASGDHPIAASIRLLSGSEASDPERGSRLPLHVIDGGRDIMATEKNRGNRETKKPKKSVPKTNAAAPSTKGTVSGALKPPGRS